jgi:regulator of sigma E protease
MVQMPVEVVLPGGGRIEQLGIAAAETSVFDVAPGGPAAAAGIAPGDIILSIDGAPVGELSTFARRIEAASKPSFEVRVMRNLEEFKVDYRPVSIWTKDDMGVEQLHLDLGLSAVPGGFAYVFPEDIPFTGGERIERAVTGAWSESAGLAVSMVVGVYHMVTGRVSLSNIGGPVMMAEMANRSASEGLLSYFDMLARVSISLAIMNLLPVPGLDGGQILLFAAEAISRRPLSFRSRQIVQYVGLASLLALMTLAFVNDLKRHWDAFAQRISSWFV